MVINRGVTTHPIVMDKEPRFIVDAVHVILFLQQFI